MQLKQVLGKIKDITFGVIAAPLIIIIMMWASILDQRAFKKELDRKRNRKKPNGDCSFKCQSWQGRQGSTAFEYIDRDEEKKLKQEQAETDLEHSAYGNMPKWAEHNPIAFWEAADLYERKNGSTYREYEIALPREMNAEQRLELVEDFIQSEIGSKYPYQFAIHNPKAMDGNDQPHVHLMFNERLQDGIERDPEQYFKRYNSKNSERGGAKKDNTGKSYQERKTDIKDLRQRWADLCNSHLEKHQIDSRIDMRSYKEQGMRKTLKKTITKPSQRP